MKTEIAKGWGLRVGGCRPYLAWAIAHRKDGIKLTERYHKTARVVLVPLAEYRRMRRALQRGEGKAP